VLGPVNRSQQIADEDRLSPERVTEWLRIHGRHAKALASAEQIADFLAGELKTGDVLLILSNGSFDGLGDKLMARLAAKVVPAQDAR
jgi:UDP-N-acetylmuramate: L-alanyl-gamma-D-glutamyl-meso-diaminopimelate ligase